MLAPTNSERISSQVYETNHHFPSKRTKFTIWNSNLERKISRVALSIFYLYAMSSIPGALAGGKEYGDCIAECGRINAENGWGLLLCPFICAPFLFA